MVADSANKTALTMLRYEQRFNVAVLRARDRAVLVRSVKREELNPNDLKARLIAHFENPMPDREAIEDALSACESDFERHLMQRLLDRGYRVQAQVGSLGYRIDMVVEGQNGTRLAVECDGDRFHGPEQWQHDMCRRRTLERVGSHGSRGSCHCSGGSSVRTMGRPCRRAPTRRNSKRSSRCRLELLVQTQ